MAFEFRKNINGLVNWEKLALLFKSDKLCIKLIDLFQFHIFHIVFFGYFSAFLVFSLKS